MDIQKAFEILVTVYGTHTKAALVLNITREHYKCLRTGKYNIPKRTKDYIIMKAQEVADRHAAQA